MAENVTDEDLELLGELGVDTAAAPSGGRTAREQRIIAGFEEIERFVEEHGRAPQHGEDRDIFERLYAVRLDRVRESEECRDVLKDLDSRGLLNVDGHAAAKVGKEEFNDEELLASLGVEPSAGNDVTQLVHVRSRDEIKAAEEIAQRNPCKEFDQFRPIFEKVQRELETGQRHTVKYKHDAEFTRGDLFILDGQKVLVADFLGKQFVSDYGRQDRRLRVVYDNGTESDLLARSLQRALYKDESSRRIVTDSGFAPLFSDDEEEGDLATGCIYVLRSKSEHPFVAQHRSVLHKIGVTGGDVKSRVANAKKDPTYLLADVEIVAIYKLANINRKALEALLHKLFGSARLVDAMGATIKIEGDVWTAPDRLKNVSDVEVNGMKLKVQQGYDGKTMWMDVIGMVQEFKDDDKLKEMKESMHAEQVGNLVDLDKKSYKLNSLGEMKIKGKEAVGVRVAREGKRDVILWFDKGTNLLVKHEHRGTDPWGPQAAEVNNEKYYFDYKAVEDLQVPGRIEVHQDGKKIVELEISEVRYHERLDDSMFAKP